MGFILKEYLASRQKLVDQQLSELLSRISSAPAHLLEAMRYSLLSPGKRLRPAMVLMASQAAGGTDRQALPAACAVEIIHTYSLIHDDLPAMDDDDLRRGQPTCHKKYGEAMAILAGDALLTMAFEVLTEHLPPRTAAACCLELARGSGASGMVGGQVEDLAWERSERTGPTSQGLTGAPDDAPHTLAALEHIHQHKTGALFQSCLKLGVWTAQGERPDGPDRALLQHLETYGRCFGLVFQITDDLIDVEGSTAETGKRVHKDAARGKLTYPGLLGISESRRRAQLLTEEARSVVQPLGYAGEPLLHLMGYVLARDR